MKAVVRKSRWAGAWWTTVTGGSSGNPWIDHVGTYDTFDEALSAALSAVGIAPEKGK